MPLSSNDLTTVMARSSRRTTARQIRFWCLAIFAITALTLAGCGPKGPKRSIVSGTVTFDGQPIANGEIRFHPTGDTQGTVAGAPIVNGEYTAKAKGGVPVGTHTVRIRAYSTDTASGTANEREDGEIQYIPQKYNRESELTAVVENQKTQDLAFELEIQEE